MNNSKITIKSILVKNLMESNEPDFYLAPDVVGSINNAYPSKKKKIFVIDFNTIDDIRMKLSVPYSTFSNFCNSNVKSDNVLLNFLNTFLQGAKKCDKQEGDDNDMLGEIVDEFGELYDDSDDLPVNISGASGYYNKLSGTQARAQYASQTTRVGGPLGYGGVTW